MNTVNWTQVFVGILQSVLSGIFVGLVIYWLDERRAKRERQLSDFRIASNWSKAKPKISLRNFDLTNTNLSGRNFVQADLEGTQFDKTWLWGTKFAKANLRLVSFRETKMLGTEFQKAIAYKADFSNSKIDKRIYPDYQLFVDFTGASLQEAIFRDANITGAAFVNARLNQSDFSKAVICECDFTGSDLAKSKWKKVKRVENCIWKNVRGLDSADISPELRKEIQRQNEKK
jgi:uncharacterized protein YjbI with pentapeptide repeats